MTQNKILDISRSFKKHFDYIVCFLAYLVLQRVRLQLRMPHFLVNIWSFPRIQMSLFHSISLIGILIIGFNLPNLCLKGLMVSSHSSSAVDLMESMNSPLHVMATFHLEMGLRSAWERYLPMSRFHYSFVHYFVCTNSHPIHPIASRSLLEYI